MQSLSSLDTTTLLISLTLPLVLWLYTSHMSSTRFPTLRNARILLLTAHPDDESMFFGPTVTSLTAPDTGNHLKILCLSTGNADGLGPRRRTELRAAAETLGVRPDDVLCLDDAKLQDGMSQQWDTAHIRDLLLRTFAPQHRDAGPDEAPTAHIDALVTFDAGGVSGHPNHAACWAGSVAFAEALTRGRPGWENPVAVYTLTSVGIVRKYAGVLDAVMSVFVAITRMAAGRRKGVGPTGTGAVKGGMFAQRRNLRDEAVGKPSWLLYVSGVGGWFRGIKAMVSGHKSQMVWFRWGWITLGRYMVVNDLRRVN